MLPLAGACLALLAAITCRSVAPAAAPPGAPTPTASRPAFVPSPIAPASKPTASLAPSPSPGPAASQSIQPAASIPAGWVAATAQEANAEVGLYIPKAQFLVGERATAIVVLRAVGTTLLDPRACNGTVYFELVLKDVTGQEVFSWTREHFPPQPNLPVLPRCTFMTTRLAPGESVQGALDFRVPTAGMLSMSARRFQTQTPAAEVTITGRQP